MVYFHPVALRDLPNTTFHIPDRLYQQDYRLDTNNAGATGASGLVQKFNSPGRPSLAIKKFDTPFLTKDKALLIFRELNLLRSMRHPNIVRLVDKYAVVEHSATPPQVPETVETIYHITYHCGVPLSNIIAVGVYEMDKVKEWTRQLLSALQYIHSLDIIHRDLHPGSLCISHSAQGHQLTLLGFGKARVVDDRRPITEQRGNDFYSAIEMQVRWKRAYDEKVDIWSMAVILCEMITGTKLFTWRDGSRVRNVLEPMIEYCGPVEEAVIAKMEDQADQSGIRAQSRGKERKDLPEFLRGTVGQGRLISPADIDNEEDLRNFLKRTLQHDARARMSADEALVHPFLNPNGLPEEKKLPSDDDNALNALRMNIWSELNIPTAP